MIKQSSILNDIIKRYPSLYRLARRVYGKLRFTETLSASKRFKNRLESIKPRVEEMLDISADPDINVLLITVDCLRYDHLSCNGYSRATTPFLDTLDGYSSPVISSSPWTYPSIASLLTGFHPHNHQAILEGEVKKFDLDRLRLIYPRIVALSEMLSLLGYATYFNSSIDLAINAVRNRFRTQKLNTFVDAEVIVEDLKKWLRKQHNNFFAYIHLKDPHEPITPPDAYGSYFGAVKDMKNIEGWSFKKPEEQRGKAFDEFKHNKTLLYDNTVRYVDSTLQDLFAFLDKKGLLDSTIIAITADHGEEFWDHNVMEAQHFYDVRGYAGVGHGHSVFDELIKLPLFISGPDVPARKEDKCVSHVDLVPTLLDLLDVQHDILFDGMNLFDAPEKRLILSEETIHGYEKKALRYGDIKYIHSEGDGVEWVFNTGRDPEEQQPIEDDELVHLFSEKLASLSAPKMVLRRLK